MFEGLKWEHVGSILIAISVAASFGVFVVSTSIKTDNTATAVAAAQVAAIAAQASESVRLDRIFEKIDEINRTLPVLVERENEDRQQITDGRGQWGSLMGRITAIESNIAAVHAEATEPKKH